ncbi:MAG: hypothetical protein HC802_14355, partial [Caldilineaceae bacterium]|nr:hypothetical protein [Caldilineaceae bacterium]
MPQPVSQTKNPSKIPLGHTPTQRQPDPGAAQPLGSDVVQRALHAPGALTPADVMALQRTVGNDALQRLVAGKTPAEKPFAPVGVRLNSGRIIQPKLKVGPVDDKYEQEADRVAQQVVSRPAPVQRQDEREEESERDADAAQLDSPSGLAATPVQRHPSHAEEEEIQAKATAIRHPTKRAAHPARR